MTILNFKVNNSKISNVLKLSRNKNHKNIIFFSKLELTSILSLYSKQVSRGFWKDYAMDSQNETAIFSIFRHTHDKPIYQIIKKRLKGLKNINEFYILKDIEVISKSSDLLTILNKFEKKLSIRKYQTQ
ncbi:DUF2794 domain-containing protein [Alphaproteobacteria bacterium]|nr:DUF2794 domain-containing protein [Alphaproteobacteria bacterium]MDC1086439.1 DUF2794 domain-containing protein [Alphaproteobacteria bacterium]